MKVKTFPCGCKTIYYDDYVEHEFCEYHKALYKGKIIVR